VIPVAAWPGFGQGQLQVLARPGGRVDGAGLLEQLRDLGVDQRRIGALFRL
jgi:hypothetical protein